MTDVWFASGNNGKINEMKMLLNKLINDGRVQLHHQGELPVFSPPPETGATFLDNARIKARALKAMKPGTWVFGEDSGLQVEGLNGLPGVHSARYAGPKAQDAENVAKLLKMMTLRPMPNRNAAFVSTIVAYDPQGVEHIFEGKLEGEIAKAAKGTQGFGYDNVFIPPGPENEQKKTLAELGLAYKNKISHRAKATAPFIEVLEKSVGG